MFAAKTYRQGVQTLLAACDEDLLGNEYREGKYCLRVVAGFYDGERVDDERLRGMMGACSVANLVGARTVAVAVAMGLVDEQNVLHVDGVPHAQFLVLDS